MWDEDVCGRAVVEESALLIEEVDSVDEIRRNADIDLRFGDDFCDGVVRWVEARNLELVLDLV